MDLISYILGKKYTDEHKAQNVFGAEVHGMRINNGVFEYFNGNDWVKFSGGGSSGDAVDIAIEDVDGNFTSDNVEGALKEAITAANEAKTKANNGKTDIASVVGTPATSGDTFPQLKTHIQNAKNKGATNLTSKGVTASGTESLDSLMGKIATIPSGVLRASGTCETGSATQFFQYVGTTGSESCRFITVTDLPFKPKRIYIRLIFSNVVRYLIEYSEGTDTYPKTVKITYFNDRSNTVTSVNFKGDVLGANVTATSFVLPSQANAATVGTWEAYSE